MDWYVPVLREYEERCNKIARSGTNKDPVTISTMVEMAMQKECKMPSSISIAEMYDKEEKMLKKEAARAKKGNKGKRLVEKLGVQGETVFLDEQAAIDHDKWLAAQKMIIYGPPKTTGLSTATGTIPKKPRLLTPALNIPQGAANRFSVLTDESDNMETSETKEQEEIDAELMVIQMALEKEVEKEKQSTKSQKQKQEKSVVSAKNVEKIKEKSEESDKTVVKIKEKSEESDKTVVNTKKSDPRAQKNDRPKNKKSDDANEKKDAVKETATVPDPFMVYEVEDVFDFNQKLSATAKFSTSINGKYLKVFPDTDEDTVTIAEYLQKAQLGYYRKTINDYPLRAVIKGLPYNCSTELICEKLEELKFSVLSVEQMNSQRDGRKLPFFKVLLKRDLNAKKIFKINRLCHMVVKIESVKTGKKAIQCFRCNKWNHYARECNMPEICGRCSGPHSSSSCTVVTKDENSAKPKCCNCGLEHVSSYLGCKAFPEKPNFTKKRSFSEVLKGKQNNKKKGPETNKAIPAKTAQRKVAHAQIQVQEVKSITSDIKDICDLVAEIKAEFGVQSLQDLKNILQNAVSELKRCKSVEEKIFAFMGAIESFQRSPGPQPESPLV